MQEVIVVIALLAAIGYLAYQFYLRFLKKDSACDSCAFGKDLKNPLS